MAGESPKAQNIRRQSHILPNALGTPRSVLDTLRELANRFASSRLTFQNTATRYGRGGGVPRGLGVGLDLGGIVGVGLPAGNWNLPTRVFQDEPVVW